MKLAINLSPMAWPRTVQVGTIVWVFDSSKIATQPGLNERKKSDEDGIRTHAGRAQWISSPSP